MYSKSACGFTVAIPLLSILLLNDFTKRAFANKTKKCGSDQYNDGGVCKECPAGYYGVNCLAVCPTLYYGIMCVRKCDCSPCHHVYGCVSTSTHRITESTSYENDNKDKIKCTNQTPEHKTNSGRNVVISVGSVFSFILILAIIREICLCCRFPRPIGRRTILDDVYTDIGEMENRRTE